MHDFFHQQFVILSCISVVLHFGARIYDVPLCSIHVFHDWVPNEIPMACSPHELSAQASIGTRELSKLENARLNCTSSCHFCPQRSLETKVESWKGFSKGPFERHMKTSLSLPSLLELRIIEDSLPGRMKPKLPRKTSTSTGGFNESLVSTKWKRLKKATQLDTPQRWSIARLLVVASLPGLPRFAEVFASDVKWYNSLGWDTLILALFLHAQVEVLVSSSWVSLCL